jgi:serine/threonine-protein kinase
MTLVSGIRFGAYEIIAPIGAGGMGEVYRARDTRLGRTVAIKVLPGAFARDHERLGRFAREAKVLASLNHPNIAAIYDFEDSANVSGLIMELVEGPTLADHLSRSPIPLTEALAIAKQICEALEYAHERGIVHRDLKPANVKITPDGLVKLLDFGLAKALHGEIASADPTSSPTITDLATKDGIILGTAAYMSPEQAKGKSADRRSDIWAFGCLFYEMLTAQRAFAGESVPDTLASVLKTEPDWSLLPPRTALAIRALIGRCLKKDPKQRLQAIGDARIAIDESISTPDKDEAPPSPVQPRPIWRRTLPWAAAFPHRGSARGHGVSDLRHPQAASSCNALPGRHQFLRRAVASGPLARWTLRRLRLKQGWALQHLPWPAQRGQSRQSHRRPESQNHSMLVARRNRDRLWTAE